MFCHPRIASVLLPVSLLSAPLGASEPRLSLNPVAQTEELHSTISEDELITLRTAVTDAPKLRQPRFQLVHALIRARKLEEARTQALDWRTHDAYNLNAVRALGDIENELGNATQARRIYSSIVELLPKDVEARRALANILKQNGDLPSAQNQLLAALQIDSADPRTAFELADVELRLGNKTEALRRFQSVVASAVATDSLRTPAKQRIAQVYAEQRHAARRAGNTALTTQLTESINQLGLKGGVENDIKVFLSWDTDRTDVDLWVHTPSRQKIFYGMRKGRHGEELYDDVTTGYGPESFSVANATQGTYTIEVHFFGSSTEMKEARGEVLVVLNEGRANEERRTIPYRIFDIQKSVTVARITVGGAR